MKTATKRHIGRYIGICLLVVISQVFFLGGGTTVRAQGQIREVFVCLDGLPVDFDVKPVIQDGRTLVPFRAIAEALNLTVEWDEPTRTVVATDGQTRVRLQIGNRVAYRNDAAINLDVPPLIIGGRTLIPVRFFCEAFDCAVSWDQAAFTVRIASPPKRMTVIGFYALGDSQTSSWTDLLGKPYPETDTGNTDIVGDLALGWYSLDSQGNLLTRSRTGWQRPDSWEKVLEVAKQRGLKTEMVVHVTDQDSTIASILADEAAMARAAFRIRDESRLYDGVNLDFEGLGWQDQGEKLTQVRERFTRFVAMLRAQLKAAGRGLTLTLHAPNSAYLGYDYKTLGALADRIIVMAYDYGPRPEPDDKVIEAVQQAREAVPSEKLVLGISAPSETDQSLLTRVGIAKRYRLRGIALWRLGLIPGNMWQVLRSTIEPRA